MEKFLIITGGNIANYEKIKKFIDKKAFIICADSGYDHAIKLGVSPNITIGDFDSLKAKIPPNAIIHPIDKDKTDTELAIEYAISKGAESIILIAALGTRADHSIANIMLLLHYKHINIRIIDEHNEIFLAKEENIIQKSGEIVSLIPLSPCVVTTHGLQYELNEHSLTPGPSIGISNISLKENSIIRVHKNQDLLIIIAKD